MRTLTIIVASFALIACGRSTPNVFLTPIPLPEPLPAPPPIEPVIETVNLVPAGTTIRAALSQPIGTMSRVGDRFSAIVTSPLLTTGGAIVVPAGSVLSGRITAIDPAEYAGQRALIRVDVDRITVNGATYPLNARIIDVDPDLPSPEKTRLTAMAQAGAQTAVILGRVYTDAELQDGLKGRSLESANGTVISLGNGDIEPVLPAGSVVTLRTRADLTL